MQDLVCNTSIEIKGPVVSESYLSMGKISTAPGGHIFRWTTINFTTIEGHQKNICAK